MSILPFFVYIYQSKRRCVVARPSNYTEEQLIDILKRTVVVSLRDFFLNKLACFEKNLILKYCYYTSLLLFDYYYLSTTI